MPYPSKKFRQNPFTTFSVIRRTDKQTEVETSPPSAERRTTLVALGQWHPFPGPINKKRQRIQVEKLLFTINGRRK